MKIINELEVKLEAQGCFYKLDPSTSMQYTHNPKVL